MLHITDFPSQYEFLAVLPRIEIQKILGYYYRIRTENYCFHGERHDFFELTYVDTGELETEVDGTLYHLKGLLYDHPLRSAQPDSRGAGGLV